MKRVTDRAGDIPTTVSPAAQQVFARLWKEGTHAMSIPATSDTAGFRRMRDARIEAGASAADMDVRRNGATLVDTVMGGTRVTEVRPEGWRENGRLIVLYHGGPLNIEDGHTASAYAAPLARITGLRVLVVDNTPAPRYNWKEIQREGMNVLLFLTRKGYRMEDIVVCGVGPGGGLAASVVLNMRNHEFGVPAAVVLWSPWADLCTESDSRRSLEEWDPVTPHGSSLRNAIDAYAAGLGLKDARVSPAYGDFSRGFPPTLIQDGTRNAMLSGSLLLYRALDSTGRQVTLDLYEGMFPGFQRYEMPEAERAVAKSASFILERIEKRKG